VSMKTKHHGFIRAKAGIGSEDRMMSPKPL